MTTVCVLINLRDRWKTLRLGSTNTLYWLFFLCCTIKSFTKTIKILVWVDIKECWKKRTQVDRSDFCPSVSGGIHTLTQSSTVLGKKRFFTGDDKEQNFEVFESHISD